MKKIIPYGWLPFAISPYESIWSLIQKFALWNNCSADQIWREFKTGQKARPRHKESELNCNYLDLNAFSEILQVPHQQIKQSKIDYYLLPGEAEYLSAQTLRYCPHCLPWGYHSPIHQMLFIKYCPYHHKKLQERCPVCNQAISIQFENDNIKKPFQCTSCNKHFVNLRILAKETDHTERNKSFSRVSDWLLARKACTEDSERFDVWLNTKISEALRRKRINSLPVIWTELTGIKPPFQIDTGVGGQLMKIVIEGKPETSTSNSANDISAYISACYDFYNNIIKEHKSCFKVISDWTSQFDYTLLTRGCRVCVLANAFLVWRMYWEDLNMPRGLEAIKNIRRFRSFLYSHYPDHFLGALSSEALDATFKEAVLLSMLWKRKEILCLDYRNINMRLNPYWVHCRRVSESEPQKIIIWRERFPSLARLSRFTLEHYKDTEHQLLSAFVR